MERTKGSQSEIGMMYQYAVTAYLAAQLSANELVKDYIVYSSVKSARKFDDIVAKIQLKETDAWFVSLIQVKYKESKKLNVSDVLKGKRIEYDLSEYISSFNEIMKDPELACRQDIHNDNIRFCVFSNKSIQAPAFFRSECTFQFNLRRYSNIDPITKILLPFGDKCWKFKCEDLLTSGHQSFLEGCCLYLEEANYNKINKLIQSSCDIDNANDIINYIKDYFNNNFLHMQGLHKQVFEIELQKIRLSNFVPPLTKLVDLVDDDRIDTWNDITLNHHITIIAKTDGVDIEGCLYACLAQRINSLLKVNIYWNIILNEPKDLNKDIVHKFIEYSKTKALRYWISPPNTLKSLILELWKLGDFPLVLKTDIKLSYFEKYMHLKRSYVVIGDMEERSVEISKTKLRIFSHLGNINSRELRDTMLKNTAISLQGHQETTLKDLLGCDVELLATLSTADVIGLMKKRIAYLKEDSLSQGNYLAFLIEDEKSPGGVNFTEPLVVGDNIVVDCRRDDIKEWVKVIKESPSCLSYAIYHLRRADQRLELVEGERENLSHYFVDQFGDSVYTSKKSVPIPIIGEATPMTEINYMGRYLRRATISYDYFNSGSKAIVLLSGDVENIDSRIQFTEIKDICNVEQIIAEERKYFIDISGEDRYNYWNRLSAIGCPMFDVNVRDGKLEIKKFKHCSNLSSYISYEGRRFSEGELFDEIGDNAVTVVTGEPGMGKSSLLKVLCNACNTRYVIFYDFIYFQHLLNRNKNLLVNPMECIFQEVHQRKPKRYSNLLRILREKRKVILVLDSFDEIIPSCEKQSLAFIKSIADTGIQIVVGSRMKDCNLLMNEFNAKVVKLEPLSNFHDKECPVKWKFVANILANVPAEFTRNPLYLNFLQVISESGESLANITRFELYEKVIKMKIECRLRRIMISSYQFAMKELVTLFERLALVVMFGKDKIEEELKWEYNTESLDCIRFGIITHFRADYPVYDHFTFVEFLVAQWLVKAKHKRIYRDAARNIYKQLMNERKLYILDILSEHLDVHNAILCTNISRIRKVCEETPYSLNLVDTLGRNALHIATICCRNINQLVLSSEILNTVVECMHRHELDMNKRDAIMEWEWTDYVNFNILDAGFFCNHVLTVELYLNRERWKTLECKQPSNIFPIEYFEIVLKMAIWRSSIDSICNLLLLQYYENGEFFNLHKLCLGLTSDGELPRNIDIETDVGLTPLHIACIYGSEAVVRYLVQSMTDSNVKDKSGCTALHYNIMRYSLYPNSDKAAAEEATVKARSQNEAITRLLLENGADVNTPDGFGSTPLNIATKLKNMDVFSLLLEKGGNINLQNTLLEAIAQKQRDVVEKLLQFGANPRFEDARGGIPFHAAVCNQGENLVRLFLERGVNVDLQNMDGETALHKAVCGRLIDMAKLLLENGANPNIHDKYGWAPFHQAVNSNDEHIIKLLLEKGAKVNLQKENGETALHTVIYQKRLDSVTLLLENGADVTLPNANGQTPLHIAAEVADERIVRLLLERGANVNLQNAYGRTALHNIIYGNPLDIMKLLANNGVDGNILNEVGYASLQATAREENNTSLGLRLSRKVQKGIQYMDDEMDLDKTLYENQVNLMLLLLEKQANINLIQNKCGKPSLNAIVHIECVNIVKLLLQNGANVNLRDDCGETVLYFAIYARRSDIIELLLENGANINVQNNRGDTPLQVAALMTSVNAVKLLLDKKADVNIQNINGETALQQATPARWVHLISIALEKRSKDNFSKSYDGLVRLLLEVCGDVEIHNGDLKSAIYHTVCKTREDIVGLLLENGANANLQDKRGSTALHFAAHGRVEDSIQLLSGKENLQNADNETALHKAINESRIRIIKMLLQNGADVNIRDEDGRTPVDDVGNDEDVKMLLNTKINTSAEFKR